MLNRAKRILAITVLGIFPAHVITFLYQQPEIQNTTTPNRAPLHNDNHPGRVPGYLVHLRSGHSLEAHLAALAPPTDVPIRKVMDLGVVLYFTEVDGTLDVVRAEPGVKHVECNYIHTVAPGLTKVPSNHELRKWIVWYLLLSM
jgi:hypothetical protein